MDLPLLLPRNKAEAKAVAAAVWDVSAAERREAAVRRVVPATAASDAERALTWAPRVGLGANWVIAIPISAPFPYVAVHVIQAPRIGRKTAYFCALVAAYP